MIRIMLILCCGLVGGANIVDYCRNRPLGTPCQSKCERAAKCGFSKEHFVELSGEERREILNRHNQLREEVTIGSHYRRNIPRIPNMNILSYDLELEFLASCWILQCSFSQEEERFTLFGKKYNQNIYRLATPHPHKFPVDFLTNAVDFWFNEWKNLPLLRKKRNRKLFFLDKLDGNTAHLLQMIWPGTRYIGCAKMHHKHRRRSNQKVLDHGYNLVCNYEPPLDVENESYSKGRRETCMLINGGKYSHLCGAYRDFDDDVYAPPILFEVKGYGSSGGICHEIKLLKLIVVIFFILRGI